MDARGCPIRRPGRPPISRREDPAALMGHPGALMEDPEAFMEDPAAASGHPEPGITRSPSVKS